MKKSLAKIYNTIFPEKVRLLFKGIWDGLKKYRIALLQLLGMIIVFLVLINVIFYFVSFNSAVCNSCHYMTPYYNQWQKSAHNQVGCVECHPNRKLLTGSYLFRYIFGTYDVRPRAEVESDVCLNCHIEKSLHTKTAFKMNITFDHGDHLGDLKRGKKLRCTSCHARGMDNKHFFVDQAVCYTCHFKGAEKGHAVTGCSVCHGTPKKVVSHEGFEFDHSSYTKIGVDCSQCHVDVISGDANVDENKCYSCHVERLSEYSNNQKVHEIHITKHGIDCEKCHNRITHGKVKMVNSLDGGCENCHQSLHVNQRKMYVGIDAPGIKDTPSRMFAAQVACQGCHIDPNQDGKSDLNEKRSACIKCHDQNYGTMLDRWIKTLYESEKLVAPIARTAESKLSVLKSKASINDNDEKTLLKNILTDYNVLSKGKASHNIDYAYKILNYIANTFDSLNIKYWKSGSRSQRSKFMSDEKEYCGLCHSLIPSKEITKYKDRDFPHKKHTSFLKCSNCHSFDNHKKMDLTLDGCDNCHKNLLGSQKIQKFGDIVFPHSKHSKDQNIECQKCHISTDFKNSGIKKESCKECHHQGKYLISACEKCHPTQSGIYNGILGGGEKQPDVMKAGSVECDACHLNDSKSVYRPKKEICSQCHDKNYESMFADWQKEIKDLINEISSLLIKVKSGKISDKNNKVISNVENILSKIKKDGSIGIHNYMIISDRLGKIKEDLNNLINK